MCGIAGIINLSETSISKTDEQLLDKMLARLKHRGLDSVGIYKGRDFVVGSVRLNIVGNDYGKQPLSNSDKILVYNGEIYDFGKYGSAIIEHNHSDTRKLFDLLTRHDAKILNDLNGMFAFCYANEQNVYLVRDRYGEKPLYYTVQENKLFFASEIKAFLEITNLKIMLPNHYFAFETTLSGSTIYKNIFQVEPGTYLKISLSSKKIVKRKYYRPNIQKCLLSYDDAVEHLSILIVDAIQKRIPNQKFASFSSGGLDSSIITAISKPNIMISSIFENQSRFNEEPYLNELVKTINIDSVRIVSKPKDFYDNLYDLVYSLDGPTTSLAAISQLLLSKKCHELGFRVVMSGLGADEFYNGYARHALASTPGWSKFYPEYNFLSNKLAKNNHVPASRYATLINRSNLTSTNNYIEKLIAPYFEEYDFTTATSLIDLYISLPPLLMMDDKLNMAYALESRSPFLDFRVVEFGLSLPNDYKIRIIGKSLFQKQIIRDALAKYLPTKIINRSDKIGFHSPINEWLQGDLSFLVQKSNEVNNQFKFNIRNTQNTTSLNEFDRTAYHRVLLAATYLIFGEKYSKDKFYQFFAK